MDWRIEGGAAFFGNSVTAYEHDVCMRAGKIVEGAPPSAADGARRLDARGCLVLPGFVIAHHHLYSSLARGMPPPPQVPNNFLQVLEQVWWRLDRALDNELNELSARLGAVEALRCGVTGIVDHHASPAHIEGSLSAIARGAERAGVRAALCYETTDRHGDAGFEQGLAENARWLAAQKKATLVGMVGGHAPFTLSDAHLSQLAALARRQDVASHIHVAEAQHDQQDARARGAASVTARLSAAGVLEGKAVIAHGVHLDVAELETLKRAGAWLTHQPRSNMNNHVGYLERARDYGAKLALGTDGINGDIMAEAEAAYFRLRDHDRHGVAETVWQWLAASWDLMSMAFDLPPEHGFGQFVPGAPADIVVLDYDAPTPVTAANLPWHLAFGISSRHVRDVFVAGELVVENRQPRLLDVGELRREAHQGAERLWSRMAALT